MKSGEEYLKSKGWDPKNPVVGGAVFKGFAQLLDEYRLEVLEDVHFSFNLCSDHSTICLGYRNLVERIKREKINEPIDKNISPVKPYKNE